MKTSKILDVGAQKGGEIFDKITDIHMEYQIKGHFNHNLIKMFLIFLILEYLGSNKE